MTGSQEVEGSIPFGSTRKDHVVEETNDADLKIAINTFVWMHAPSHMTLGEAEQLACDIFYKFEEARNNTLTTAKAGV